MGEKLEPQVECYSGSAYAERPIAFQWEGQRVTINDIQERWRLPGRLCFRVGVEDGRRFELFYTELNDVWEINEV
jgi:hypothetical protein